MPTAGQLETRSKVVGAAAHLLQHEGAAAMTTRAVADAAGVQAPTIYRLFGDKDGLLEAVVEHVMAEYVSEKAGTVEAAEAGDVDPVTELRAGWHTQIEFGLANPALFRLLSDPERVMTSPAARSGRRVLQRRIDRIAQAGRLRVSERRAVEMVQAAGVGAISTLLSLSPDDRDPDLAPAMLDVVLARILTDDSPAASGAPVEAAVTLHALVPTRPEFDEVFSEAERTLLTEWLARAVRALSASASR